MTKKLAAKSGVGVKKTSATENWTRVSCVTGRDNDHYTIADQLHENTRFDLNETLTIQNKMLVSVKRKFLSYKLFRIIINK